jgi:glutaredoxin
MLSSMFPRFSALLLLGGMVLFAGCDEAGHAEELSGTGLEGAPIEPPFDVSGDLDGLLLVWFDDTGPHTASSRDEIPEAHRANVRVDDLSAAPDERLDPEFVYVADLRSTHEGDAYAVRQVRRAAYDELVDRAQGIAPRDSPETVAAADPSPTPAAGGDADVVIYGADWCNACRATAQYLASRGVAYVERNVERDPRARAEMQEKAQAAGIRPTGIPVIDFRGTILTGFDQRRLEQLIARGT